jgi:aminoglycoside phosphotransferase
MQGCLVLIHGDYCLTNVLLDGWALSGFIDLGRCGVAGRYHISKG